MASPKSQISPFKVGILSVDPKHASDDGTFGKFINIFHMNLTLYFLINAGTTERHLEPGRNLVLPFDVDFCTL